LHKAVSCIRYDPKRRITGQQSPDTSTGALPPDSLWSSGCEHVLLLLLLLLPRTLQIPTENFTYFGK
jgi:hypothetical protein